MKPFSKLFLCASFGLTTLAFGCAGMNTGTTDGTGSSTAPAKSTSPAPSTSSAPSTSPAPSTSSAPSSASSTSPVSKGSVASAPSDPTRVSPGTQGDTLDACLARIPSNATSGQRMLATMSCERDAKSRTSIDAVPGK